MAGRVQWEAQVDSNVAKLLSETKELRNELETINKKDIKLDIDTKSLNSIVDLFGKMENHLRDLKKVFIDVGEGAEFSPLLKMINNVQSSIDKLSSSVKGIGLNMNIDFGSDAEMEAKIQSKISNALQAYQRLFDHIKMSGVGGSMINTNFFEFDINQYDTMMGKLQAYKKFIENMRNEAKAYYGGQDVLFQDTEKSYWTSASAAMGQVTKAFNEMNASADTKPLDNLFGKTDLTEVVSQLGLIVNKLEEISSMASKLAKVDISPTPIKDTFQGDLKASAESSAPAIKDEAKAIEQVAENAEKASKGKDNFAKANKKVKESADSSSKAVSEEASEFNKIIGKLDGYNTKLANFTVKPADGNRYPIYQKNIDDLTEKINKLQVLSEKDINLINTNDIEDAKALQKQIDELIFKMSKMSASEKGFDPLGADKALEKINSELKKNSAMSKEAKRQIQGFYDEIRSGNPSKPIKDLLDDMYKLIQVERLAGREGKSFMDIFKEKVVYGAAANMAGMIGIYDIINVGRQGITVIRELDTALTEMRKVSDETVSSLERFQDVSFDLADDVGTTAKQIQNSTASWMRLGEAMSEASESAQVSNILLNVSEFEGIDEATESLVAMSAAYKDLEKIEIVDVLNKIGNEYSISTDGIATALQDSASALVTANNDLNEAVALITAGNAVTQDPNSVGAGMRTISLRLVGTEEAKAELEKLGEDVSDMVMTSSKVRDTIMNATKAASENGMGFDILDNNGNYKSTYEIMQGLADLYDEIVAKDKELGTNNLNLLLETISGKNRANIAASILQNGDMLRDVFNDAQNADGSAQEELDKFLESIDGRMAKLSNQAQEFWYKFIDSDTIKNGITLLTELLGLATDFVDAFGVLGTAGIIGGGILGVKNAGKTYECMFSNHYCFEYAYLA